MHLYLKKKLRGSPSSWLNQRRFFVCNHVDWPWTAFKDIILHTFPKNAIMPSSVACCLYFLLIRGCGSLCYVFVLCYGDSCWLPPPHPTPSKKKKRCTSHSNFLTSILQNSIYLEKVPGEKKRKKSNISRLMICNFNKFY